MSFVQIQGGIMMNHVATLYMHGSAELFYDVLAKDGKFFAVLTSIEETGIRQGGTEAPTGYDAKKLVMGWARADYRHVLSNHIAEIHGDVYPVLKLA